MMTRAIPNSKASSSIHNTTERQTNPTTLRKWPGTGGTPGVEPSASISAGALPRSKVFASILPI